VTSFVAISRAVQRRIRTYYGRESVVIHPPVRSPGGGTAGSARDHCSGDADRYYLIVSRLVAYRRIDIAVSAFNRLGYRLVIAGEGPDRGRLEAMAAPNVEFLGRVPDRDLSDLFTGCRTYILPGEEDFGIAPVQAQAAGRPVIAYAGGGALETVVDGVTGAFFHTADADALAGAVLSFDPRNVDPQACRANAEKFAPARFRERIGSIIVNAFGGESDAA
jgi:glycosyltransferase involved in cell wall biosynthesis